MTAKAWGHGLATVASDGTILDAWYPSPRLGDEPGDVPDSLLREAGEDPRRDVTVDVVTRVVDLDQPPTDVPDAYLRLHVLSYLLAAPNTVNLEGLMALLPIVVWTNIGPVLPATFATHSRSLMREGVTPKSVDKMPPLLDYIIPKRVRISETSRVRLGAYLSPGTFVVPEGFVNFNAGTLGAAMVEGRISQGVVVGDGADIGGGASIMGTLSGGGAERVAVGEHVLLGANSGVGISIGDGGIVEAGLYVTAGTKVTLYGAPGEPAKIVKAVELSGVPDLVFRRNSASGAVEALPRTRERNALNPALHP